MNRQKVTVLKETVTVVTRRAWPKVVQYELEDGTLSNVPPTLDSHPSSVTVSTDPFYRPGRSSVTYRYVIHDLAAFEALDRRGALRDPKHAGRRGRVTDNRRVT